LHSRLQTARTSEPLTWKLEPGCGKGSLSGFSENFNTTGVWSTHSNGDFPLKNSIMLDTLAFLTRWILRESQMSDLDVSSNTVTAIV
jgi:hypothetical protein